MDTATTALTTGTGGNIENLVEKKQDVGGTADDLYDDFDGLDGLEGFDVSDVAMMGQDPPPSANPTAVLEVVTDVEEREGGGQEEAAQRRLHLSLIHI